MAPPRQEEETMADRIKATISGSEDSSTASSASEDPVPAPSSKRRVLRRPYLILSIVVMSSILLAVVIFLAVTVRPSRAQLPPTPPPPPKDPDHRLADGHHRVLFTFGASFTTTGFSLNRPWPSEQNVIGNPAWPGRTTSNGPVWPNYLATNHNSTLTYLFNFAESGAVTDKQLTRPGNARSFEEQIEHLFIPNFVGEGRKPEAEWDPLTTSFGVFVGLNE
ncbi:MAG: hypothetical protein M1837_003806 [Sclerophora amabilis]|nr:MAG: hypothetical protein M1837_003806 [Sclerophora amabilis]